VASQIPRLLDASKVNKVIEKRMVFQAPPKEDMDPDNDDLWRPYLAYASISLLSIPCYEEMFFADRCIELAVVLSILNTNKYLPKFCDPVLIGSNKLGTIQIPLSLFCHAFLQYKISQIFITPQLLASLEAKKNTTSRNHSTLSSESICMKQLGISPLLKGIFTPFVYFEQVADGLTSDECHDSQFDVLDQFIKPWLSPSCSYMEFSSHEDGWCPGFWNANFSWYNFGDFKTVYNPVLKQIVVTKVDSRQFTNI